MRGLLFALSAILAVVAARVVVEVPHHLLGAEKCTRGPGYWCQNITTAAGCQATTHCIKNYWESMKVEDDKDSVCSICKDMVQQARDQLESNQTQEDLKAVFEGSCALMIIKPIVQECDVLVDEFIPELVETLASQMNPSVVCSVAGLCNSAHIDRLIEEQKHLTGENSGKITVSLSNDELEPDNCSKCYTIASHMESKLSTASRDKVLDQMLLTCGHMSSFSDACSSIVLGYFPVIYSHLQDNFKPRNICHLSGQCSANFHKHEDSDKELDVEVRPMSSVGLVDIGDDLPCKLCEQLVKHLRDLLIANTTENEFEQVLEGLCKQTKSFAPECKSIVDQYYPEIYKYLVNGLDSNGVCQMATICPEPGKNMKDGPIWPALPKETSKVALDVMKKRKMFGEHGAGIRHEEVKKTEAEEMLSLPMRPSSVFLSAPNMDVKGQQTCAFCEYFLHFVQTAITNPTTEEEVEQLLTKVCKKLPKSVKSECDEFLENYSQAVVALLAQAVDPSVVCPMINVCPSQEFMEAWAQAPKEMMLQGEVEDKPTCPLCLLAIDQVWKVIKNNKTEQNIEDALENLCTHLPKDLSNQCDALVKGYSKELIEMLMADLTPQEICVYIKLCNPDNNPGPKNIHEIGKDREILSNEIPDYPMKSVHPVKDDVKCVVCEFIMEHVEKAMRNDATKNKIEKVVHGICNHLPSTVAKECNDFVDEYADVVIELLSKDVSPQEICSVIGLCQEDMERLHASITECALCQGIISTIGSVLADPSSTHKIEEVVSNVCKYLAPAKQEKCSFLMDAYEQSIINILQDHGDVTKICSKLALCSASDYFAMMSGHKSMIKSTSIAKSDKGIEK